MNINTFAVKVARLEGGKQNLTIAQIKEVMKCVNFLVGGALYIIIKLMKG